MSESEFVGLATLAVLGAVLALFVYGIARRSRGSRPEGLDFGWGFSLFVVAWIIDEAVDLVSPPEWNELNEFVHMLLMVAFAGWLNVRLVWALRQARHEEEQDEEGVEA